MTDTQKLWFLSGVFALFVALVYGYISGYQHGSVLEDCPECEQSECVECPPCPDCKKSKKKKCQSIAINLGEGENTLQCPHEDHVPTMYRDNNNQIKSINCGCGVSMVPCWHKEQLPEKCKDLLDK